MEKICPVRSGTDRNIQCIREKCEWWIKHLSSANEGRCAIVALSGVEMFLKSISGNLLKK